MFMNTVSVCRRYREGDGEGGGEGGWGREMGGGGVGAWANLAL
jgi:hypothetical protein